MTRLRTILVFLSYANSGWRRYRASLRCLRFSSHTWKKAPCVRHPWISLCCFVLILAVAPNGFGQCNPNPLRPSLLPPCPTIADQLTKAHEAAKDFVREVDKLNALIASARSRFWKTFPNGPGFEAAQMAFLDALWQKDIYYLQFSLMEGVNGRVPKLMNFIDMMGGGNTLVDLMNGGEAYKKFPTNVDGGIRPYAFPLFVAWVDALRRAEGRETDGAMATPAIMARVLPSTIEDKSNWRKAYEDARNWAEFMSSGLDISKYATPQVYLLRQMEADVCLMLTAAKPADLPEPTAAALDLYNLFVKMFGEKEVLAAAGKVLHTPKNSVGGLAKRADVAIGTYHLAPHPSPYLLFLTEVTKSSPRNYAISLCIDQYGVKGVYAKEKWANAFSVYNQLIAKYGEANVLSASARLKDVPKDSEGRLKGDPKYSGLLYWFQTLLKDPKAALPDALPHFRASSYDPRWLGKKVEVRGTVSRVDLDKSGSPRYATIYFKESRADGIMGFSPHADMLQSSYGEDFSGLVGKPIEIYGEVNQWREGAGVRITDRDQVKVLEASTALGGDFTESRPDWLTAAKPAAALVDNPKYLAWKKFPPGTKVTYVDRLLSEYQPGTNQYTRNKISRSTGQLVTIDDKRAVIKWNSTVWNMQGGTSNSERELIYQAKEPPGQSGAPAANESGQETLEISGKKIATHWETSFGILAGTFAQPDKQKFVKTWTSDEVPGGLVLKNQQDYREILQGQTYRSITQTILETVENVEPELGGGPKQASTASPGAPNPAAPTSPTANQPRAQTAPATPSPTPTTQVETKTAPTTQAPAPPVQPTAPKPKRRFGWPVTLPPILSGQPNQSSQAADLSARYSSLVVRAAQAKTGLAQLQRQQAGSNTELPDDVRASRDRLDAQMQAVALAVGARNNAQATQSMREAENSVTVIEQFLAK